MNIFCKNKKPKGWLKKAGFTLIELLVVISIISLLSSVVLVSVKGARDKAQVSKVRSGMVEFAKALEIYRVKYGYYPQCTSNNHNCYLYASIYTNPVEVDEGGAFASDVSNELKNKQVLSQSLAPLLRSLLDLGYVGYDLYYVTDPGTLQNVYKSGGYKCGGNNSFNEYWVWILIQGKDGEYTLLNSSQISGWSTPSARSGNVDFPYDGYCLMNQLLLKHFLRMETILPSSIL